MLERAEDTELQHAQSSDPIVNEAIGHFKGCHDKQAQIRRAASKCFQFFIGGEQQWNDAVLASYRAQKRPDLTYNQLPQFVYNVWNEHTMNPMEIKISKDGHGASAEAARVRQDIIRKICNDGQGRYAVNHADRDHIIGGQGFFRICTDWASNRSSYQRIYLAPIESWASVYFIGGNYPDFRDARGCLIFIDLPKWQYEEDYPDKSVSGIAGVDGKENVWVGKSHVRILEYIKLSKKKIKLIHLTDGRAVPLNLYNPQTDVAAPDPDSDPSNPLPLMRDDLENEVTSYMMNGYEQLRKPKRWAGKYIPIIPIMGEHIINEGEEHLKGLLDDLLDPQVASNFMKNEQVLNVAVAAKTPWLVADGQIEDHEEEWKEANRKAYSALKYQRYDEEGRDLGQPMRNDSNPPVQGVQMVIQSTDQSMMQACGIYQNALGDQQSGPQESGVAVLQRKQQSQKANFRFTNEKKVAMNWLGEQLLDLIPKVMDVGQVLELEGLDGKDYKAAVWNSELQGQLPGIDQRTLEGVKGIFDLSVGSYGVTVGEQMDYDSEKEESQAFFQAFAAAAPELVPRFADLWARSLSFAESEELADRLMPADVAMKGEGDPKQQLTALKAAYQQQAVEIQKYQQAMQQLLFEKHAGTDKAKAQLHLEMVKAKNNKEIAEIESDNDLLIEHAKMKQADSHKLLDHRIAAIESDLDRKHEKHMALFDASTQSNMADKAARSKDTVQ